MTGRREQFEVPASLRDASDARAAAVLAAYYQPLTSAGAGYTGGKFDTFDPSGTRSACANTFTADDLVAVSLLSVEVPARAAVELLVSQRRRFEVLLESIGPDRELVTEASVDEPDFRPAWELWRALLELPGLGPTTVSKLMARKRPRLIPIFDSVIDKSVLGGTGVLWSPLHAALIADDRALQKRLLRLRAAAELDASVSALRVFDVLAWMDGSGNSHNVLTSSSFPPLAAKTAASASA
ncbi:hypothetical protein ASH01_11515 [Terrabacter sp. Soil811]|uniref:DUF6308 family protein n=1 Tax=Terrabacter sp. Soil811 TaxID=1736419 RepID=UPI0006F915FE|nr:DUF6308 family protein [Terrabacter sp. Soil811]KRF44613.1 hypothetical protein ASH01_11515 [Terrabacter sp. Soil811]